MPRSLSLLVLIAALASLAGCATPAGTAGDGPISIKGALSYRARIALPPDSRAVVALKDVSRPDGAVVTEQRIDLAGRQVPIPFELALDRATLDVTRRYALRGAIFAGGRPLWASDPVMIDRPGAVVDVGTLALVPVRGRAFATEFRCGDQRITVDFTERAMRLLVGADTFELRQTVAASGARYEAAGDATTSFWNKGREATLVVKGQSYPTCVQVFDDLKTFTARGNEPGWRLDIDGATMTLVTQFGAKRVAVATPAAQRTSAFTRYAARSEGGDLTVTVFDRTCKDTMTGMPHPYAVEVVLDRQKLAGCGGDPATLLQGPEWVVEDINGQGIVDRSRASLVFGPDGRVSGRASCNNFTGQYKLTGEGLTVSQTAGTMMACPPALMDQEAKFLEVLRSVRRFDLTADGALVLQADDRGTIKARRLSAGAGRKP
jgi:heat shock protein HslJ/uncharacterized lipoprotein YbaY